MSDPATEFRAEMAAHGLTTKAAINADGEMHRFHVEGDKPGSENGYYALHLNGRPAGHFGSWRTGLKRNWTANGAPPDEAIDMDELARRMNAEKERRARELAAKHERVAAKAARQWAGYAPTSTDHAYLLKKGIQPHGARVDEQGRLVITMADGDGKIWSLQAIGADGAKRFMPGGRKTGCMFWIGEPSGERIVIAEGFATAGSIRQATNLPVAVAFDRTNLEPVALTIRQKWPEARIAICADDDAETPGNPGLADARKAAAAIGAAVAIPARREPDGKAIDFNDLHLSEGLDAIAAIVNAAFEKPDPGAAHPTDNVDTTEAPWPEPLAPEAFHGIAGEIVRAIEPESEADPAAILLQLLTAAGNILGPGAFVRVEGDKHPPRLFTIVVGPTAKARKGSSWGRVRSLLEETAPEWAGARVTGGLSSGEGLIHAVRDPIIKTEADKKTGAAMEVVVDQGVEDKRLMVIEGEFARVLRAMERAGNTLSALLRDCWDHGTLRTIIKNSPDRATGAHISLVGHITAEELRRYLDRTELANGLANRALFIVARRSKLLPRGSRPIDWAPIERRLRETLAGAPSGELHRTDAAWRIWEEVYPVLSADRPGLLGAILGRAEAQVLRLAVIYALLDRSEYIDTPHMLAALAIWDRVEASTRYIFGDTLGDPVADEILRALRERPEGLTRTELAHHFGRHLSGEQLGRALAVLDRGGFVSCQVEVTGGRPAQRWRATR